MDDEVKIAAAASPSDVELGVGAGWRWRRVLGLRAGVAAGVGLVLLALAVYGGYGVVGGTAIGVPCLVIGLAGGAAQLSLAAAFMSARAAIIEHRYARRPVSRARRSVSVVLVLLVAGAAIGFFAVTAALGRGLGGLTAFGLIGVFGLTADGWRRLPVSYEVD